MKKIIENIKYFDVHSHLHSNCFNQKENGQKIVEDMLLKGICSTVIGVDFADSLMAVKMAQENENLYCSIGQHPVDTPKEVWNTERYQKLLNENREIVVCIGECGLDYYWPSKDTEVGKMSQEDFIFEKKRQKKLFENQIDFAMKNDLPLMLHVRSFENADAHTDVFEILDTKQREYDKKGLGKIRANFHFFTEGPEVVAEIVARDYMISLPGVITFANLDKTVLSIPLEYIMSETDSPFAAPKPYRGKTNTSLYISEILKKISEVKSIDEEKVREQTIKNTLNFFNIPKNLN